MKKVEIKSLSDFVAMLNANDTSYTGLVESIGYVYWTTETLYFIRTNPEQLWAIPKFKQIPFPYFQRKDTQIETKTLHTLHVLPKKELMKLDYDAYYAFYGIVDEMLKFIHKPDAIKDYREMPLPEIQAKGAEKGNDGGYRILSIGSEINDQIGAPLDAVSLLIDNKPMGKIGEGLSIISIIDEVTRGEYWSATGDALLFAAGKTKLSPYLTAISLGTWMYNTKLMQMRLAQSSSREYLQLRHQWKKETNLNEKKKLERLMQTQLEIFEECMHNLGIKY